MARYGEEGMDRINSIITVRVSIPRKMKRKYPVFV
jgi:hypothetical protein